MGSYLNEDQQEYVRELGAMPPEAKCWCGWYPKDQCWSGCRHHGKGLTCADKLMLACPDCGNTPWVPGDETVHNIKCPRRDRPVTDPTEGDADA